MTADFSRSEALLGTAALDRLAAAHVVVVGVGGVGSWCAEALVRTGLGRITLIDDDVVAPSNVNRQAPATASTLGRPKVIVMRERLLDINPACAVEARVMRCKGFSDLPACDAIVDAIDSVPCKAELILGATEAGIPIVSSLGAALRTDPSQVTLRRFDRVEGDGLARALRQYFRKAERWPGKTFECVCSLETPHACSDATRGSIMPITATFGMHLASAVLRMLCPEAD